MKFYTHEVIKIVKELDEIMNKDLTMTAAFQWIFIDNYDALKKVFDKHDRLVKELISPHLKEGHFEIDATGKVSAKEEYAEEFNAIAVKVNDFLMTESEVEIKLIPRSETPTGLSINDLKSIKFMFE